MLVIQTRPSRYVVGQLSKWISAYNPIIFGFYNDSYVPDPAYRIVINVYESGTDKLLGVRVARLFANGRVNVDVSGILRGYLNNENAFAYNVVNKAAVASSIKFYLTYQETKPDPTEGAFIGYANSGNGDVALVGSASVKDKYVYGDSVYLYFSNGNSVGPYSVIGFLTSNGDIVIDFPYLTSGTPGIVSKLSPELKNVVVSDMANSYWATASAKQRGDLYGQNMGEHVPFYIDDQPAKFLNQFDQPVYWEGWPFSLSFVYGEGLSGVEVQRIEQQKDLNKINYGAAIVDNIDATQIETVNHLTISGNYPDNVQFVELSLKTGQYTQDHYVALGYVVNGYIEVK